MNLKKIFLNAKAEAHRKSFSKEDQIELSFLEHQIDAYGIGYMGGFGYLYVDEAITKYATIVETKGSYKGNSKRRGK